MSSLTAGINTLNKARVNQIFLLGICVGMQIFFEGSEEDPNSEGLAWFKGKARALDFPKKPMVGWAELESEFWPNDPVYFVNSFAIKASEKSIAQTTYGETFCAAVQAGSFTGVQFHPEKSSQAGSNILRQALGLTRRSSMNLGNWERQSLMPRIIVCLDVDKGRVVKGTNFKQLRDMGDPVELALAYEAQGADELVFLDISASNENRPTALKLVTDIATNLVDPIYRWWWS